MNIDPNTVWHTLDPQTVCQKLVTSSEGLSKEEAKKRLQQFGSNLLQLQTAENSFRILCRQFQNPIVYILLFSTLLALSLGKTTDSLVILGVVVINTIIGFFQEHRAYETIKALKALVPHQTTVLREGQTLSIHAADVVLGDLLVLQAGDRISADVRLLSVKNLQCNESMLTGESLPVQKHIESMPLDALTPERKCIAYNGTYVTAGTGLGIVIATGLHTEFGKISQLIEQVTPLETPLSLMMKKIAQGITSVILVISFLLFLIAYFRGTAPFEAGLAAITLAVAAIPEGLPAIITIAASIGVHRMAQKKAIIRQLPAVEALGSTSIICTDKTGTLTCNEITVQKIWTPSGFSFVSGIGFSLEGKITAESEEILEKEVKELLQAAILCSDACIDQSKGGWLPVGDPTEIALVIAGRKMDLFEEVIREAHARIDVFPFESEKRIMATLNSFSLSQTIFLKGAPEEVLKRCKEPSLSSLIQTHFQAMAKEGMRVLAIAKKSVEGLCTLDEESLQEGFSFLGIVGMIDPPRAEVYQALQSCFQAGIQVKMMTGDHPLTAETIGKELHILKNSRVITGKEIDQLPADQWKKVARENHVFARVSPEHKLKLVEALQAEGDVVAMTGDGVNDAAALKRADIGVAMGIKGTEVAKEASDMILANDNFASIEAAVQEGRRIYDNLIKSLAFVFPTSFSQALVILIAVLFFPIEGTQLLHPMSPVQILWVNLIVAVALSLPLAFESPEPHIMQRPPRKKGAPILGPSLLFKTGFVSFCMALGTIGLFLFEYGKGLQQGLVKEFAISQAQTMAVTTLILFQIFYLFQCRSLSPEKSPIPFFSNGWIFVGTAGVFAAQIGFIYLPVMNRFFQSSPLSFKSWMVSLGVTCLLYPVMALERCIQRKFFCP